MCVPCYNLSMTTQVYHKSVCKIFSVGFASFCFCNVAITKCVTLLTRHDKGHAFQVTFLKPGTSVVTLKQLPASFQKFPSVFRRVKKGMAKIITGSVDDLATLSELNEKIILEELQARYSKDVIYVSTQGSKSVSL